MAPLGDDSYHPQDALRGGINTALITGGFGLLFASVQNTLQKRNVGPWGVFTRGGGTVAVFTAVGGVYEFTKIASANLREKKDHYNEAIGGFAAGAVLGLKSGRLPAILGWGAGTAIAMSAFDFMGGSLSGRKDDPSIDEFERKEQLRKNRRRPIEETIAELGEGRGIKAPGYEERRRQRLKEKYGVDINPVSVNPDA